jgi:membrane protein
MSLGQALSGFYRDGCFTLAASMSYFSIMSLIPLLFIIITAFGYILGSYHGAYSFILSYLKNIFPHMDNALGEELKKIIANRRLGGFSLLLYIWLASQVFFSLEYAINSVFKAEKRRHLLLTTFFSLLMITLAGIFFSLSFFITSTTKLLRSYPMFIAGIDISRIVTDSFTIKFLIPFILVSLTFTWIYKYLPNCKIRLRNAALGGIITALLWEASKHFFTWYITHIMDIGRIYGSLATFIVFFLWIFYSCSVVLFGAEFVFALGTSGKRNRIRNG